MGTARSLSSRFTRLHRQTELCERINRNIMNFILSSVVVLLVGALACTLLKVLARLVVMAGVCVSVTFLALCVIRNREIIAQRISSGTFHAIAKDDQKFLDDLLRNENQEGQQQLDTARVPVANAELQINGETVRRAELVNTQWDRQTRSTGSTSKKLIAVLQEMREAVPRVGQDNSRLQRKSLLDVESINTSP